MSDELASTLINDFATGMVLAAIGIVWSRSLGWALLLICLQSLALAGAGLCAAIATHSTHIFVGSALTLAVKVVAAPALLWVDDSRRAGVDRSAHGRGARDRAGTRVWA
jgi:hydrogenase-4 membrane subunit HyfE